MQVPKCWITFKDFLPKKLGEDEEEKEIVVTEQDLTLLNIKSNSSIKTIYLQYKKHGTHPSILADFPSRKNQPFCLWTDF